MIRPGSHGSGDVTKFGLKLIERGKVCRLSARPLCGEMPYACTRTEAAGHDCSPKRPLGPKRRPACIRGEDELQGLAAGKVSIGLRTPAPDFQRVGINHGRGQAVTAPQECHIRLTAQPTQMDAEARAGLLKAL